MKSHGPNLKIGLLGGGQLARMMALQAHRMGLIPVVLSTRADDPAAQVTSQWQKGDPNRAADVKKFLRSVDVATFESEFMDGALLDRLSRETRTPVFPKPLHMQRLQDRLTQKQLIENAELPTAPWCKITSFADARKALAELGGAMVLKKRRFGYDGYGTYVVRDLKTLAKLEATITDNEHGFIAEAFIPFRRELAVMIARSRKGALLDLPFVETFQENSRCLWVRGPVQTRQTESLRAPLLGLLDQLRYVGVMGVELFETDKGLMVNELAPRVHNSGHYSLDALEEDQFTLHLKAVLDMPFNQPQLLAPGFAMLNLLGTRNGSMSWKLQPEATLHWYGKSENRKGRKMGHLNALGSTPDQALEMALAARKGFRV